LGRTSGGSEGSISAAKPRARRRRVLLSEQTSAPRAFQEFCSKANALTDRGFFGAELTCITYGCFFNPPCAIMVFMNRDDIIEKLKEREADLRAQGVAHAALFGSVARGDNGPYSDIDIMVELDPAARVTMFDYVGIKEYIEAMFNQPVDVVNRDGLKPRVRPKATADAIYSF
jgi:uncharacterized protein